MAEIDIRNMDDLVIDTIRFAEDLGGEGYSQANAIKRNDGDGNVFLIVETFTNIDVRIEGREHAEALVRAINKAMELGWV